MIPKPVPVLFAFAATLMLTTTATAAFQLRQEGENRTTDAGSLCNTFFDGERVQTVPFVGASDGLALFFPNTGCWAAYEVFPPLATRLTLGVSGPGGVGECGQWILLIDGAIAGWTAQVCQLNAIQRLPVFLYGLKGGDGNSFLALPPGLHVITVVSSITAGPGYANMYLDYIDFNG